MTIANVSKSMNLSFSKLIQTVNTQAEFALDIKDTPATSIITAQTSQPHQKEKNASRMLMITG